MKENCTQRKGILMKLLAVMFAVALLVSIMVISAKAYVGFRYTFVNKQLIITGYEGYTTELTIPSIMDDGALAYPTPVKGIGTYAFKDCIIFSKITISNGIEDIGYSAFENCYNLESINIPSSVRDIKDSTFSGCRSLTNITISNGVTRIGNRAFCNCDNLKSITIPNSVKSISSYAFPSCDSLTSITIPNGVTEIGAGAFIGCKSLEYITIPNGITSIKSELFESCYNLKQVILPSNLKSIGEEAFYKCESLEFVEIPRGVETIGKRAFSDCKSLKNITIPSSVSYIDGSAFSGCDNLESIVVEKGNPVYHSKGNCIIETATGKLVAVLKKTEIPADGSVKSIGDRAFYGCENLKTMTIPKSVKSIGDEAFSCCENLQSVTIPESVTSIGAGAFDGCTSLTSITIPGSVTSIGKSTFKDCTSLQKVTIPKSLKSIGENAFSGCSKLKTVRYEGTKAQWKKITVDEGNDKLTGASFTYNVCYHKYSNICDTTCNKCSAKRTVKHTYSSTCDKTCNVCKATRKASAHTYKNVTTKATLTKNGSTSKKCTRCGYVASKTVIKQVKTVKLAASSYTYNGNVRTPAVTVKNSAGKVLKKGTDYTVTYAAGRKNIGTYKVTVKMIGKYSGTKTLSYKINPINISKCEIVLSNTSYVYDGQSKIPSVIVLSPNGTKLTESTYTLTYSLGRKNVGTYKVTIKMKGNYSGTKVLTFKILPKAISIGSIKAGVKSFAVSWKPNTSMTGYEIQYSTAKSFSGAKTVTMTSNKTNTKTVKSLTKGKTYYVRIRTYKTVNGVKFYSAWSAAKTVKAK